MPLPLAMHVCSILFGAHFDTFKASSWELLGHIFGSKTAPDRNCIWIPEIADLEAPFGLDLFGFWVPLGVPFLDHVGQIWLWKPFRFAMQIWMHV